MVVIDGENYECLAQYYFDISKSLLKGHSCSTTFAEVLQHLKQHDIYLTGLVVNMTAAICIDIVHWCCVDFLAALQLRNKNRSLDNVRTSCFPTYTTRHFDSTMGDSVVFCSTHK